MIWFLGWNTYRTQLCVPCTARRWSAWNEWHRPVWRNDYPETLHGPRRRPSVRLCPSRPSCTTWWAGKCKYIWILSSWSTGREGITTEMTIGSYQVPFSRNWFKFYGLLWFSFRISFSTGKGTCYYTLLEVSNKVFKLYIYFYRAAFFANCLN